MKILWYSVFSFLLLYLESTVRKEIWIRTNSVAVMETFRKHDAKSYLITAMFKVLSEQLQAPLTAAF